MYDRHLILTIFLLIMGGTGISILPAQDSLSVSDKPQFIDPYRKVDTLPETVISVSVPRFKFYYGVHTDFIDQHFADDENYPEDELVIGIP